MLVIRRNEDTLIDGMRTQTNMVQPVANRADNPGEDLMHVGGEKVPSLPDPSVGGQNSSGFLNGWSTGVAGVRARLRPFLGAMVKVPAITNPIQGEVGKSASGSRSASLYQGVLNQGVQYNGSALGMALDFVGVGKRGD